METVNKTEMETIFVPKRRVKQCVQISRDDSIIDDSLFPNFRIRKYLIIIS